MRVQLILLLALWAVVRGTPSCVAPERTCDFVCDCPSCEDEQDCGYMGEPFVCDFEGGQCGWSDASFNAPYKWERRQRGDAFTDTGPSSDYTKGTATGWFMAVTSVKSEQVSAAILVSPEMRHSAPTCRLSLRYFIWDSGHSGLGPAPLWVSVRYRDLEEAVLWRPEPSSMRGWREASVHVGRVSSEFRLVFHSERAEGGRADVALDQLHFHHCALPAPPGTDCANGTLRCKNGACVEQRLVCDGTDDCGDGTDEEDCGAYHRCDFEDDLCEFWDLRSLSSLKWVRTNQKNISITDPRKGPGRDHSTNTAAGYFLYVTVPESGLKMDWAAFQSELLEPTTVTRPCKMVMYTHQFGPRSGGLTVMVADKNIYPVWERGGALGDLWVRAEVAIVTNTSFQIVVMAAIRDFDYGGVGIDSIVLSPECRNSSENWTLAAFPESPKDPCTSPDKMCDFHVDCNGAKDENKCGDFVYLEGHKGWTDSSVGDQGWLLHENSTSKEVYLYVAEVTGQQRTEAQTKTPLLGPSGPACTLSFDYALTGSPRHIGELSVRVMDSLLGPQPKVWEFGGKTGTEAESWKHTDVHIGLRRERFQLAFEAELAELHSSAQIRVKNVFFRDCNEYYYPYSPTGVSCNFEENLCGWYQDNSDNFDWTLLEGMDHSIGVGRSLVVDFWSPSLRGAFGRVISYTLNPSALDMCLSFYYKLYGPNTGVLNVKLLDGNGYELILWSRTGAHGNMWHEAHCPVPHQLTPFRLMFEAVRSGFDGRVAVDDVALTYIPCTSLPRMCSFEGNRCDFSSSGKVHWRHGNGLTTSASGPKNDHTLETPQGYYMMVNSGSDVLPYGAVSSLTSPVYYGVSRKECLGFWYHMSGDSPGSLTVYVKPVKGERVKMFSNSLNQGDVWRYGNGNISSGGLDWQLEFEVVGAGGKDTHVAIDDIYVSSHPCESQGSKCSLERGLCDWSNTQDVLKDRLDWELTSREAETHYPVPEADHTHGHEKGHFLFIPSSDRTAANQNAWLLSPHLPPTKGTCLKFWAYMPYSDVSVLKVWRRSSEGLNTELLSTSRTGGAWRRFDINITSAQEYQIVLDGVKGASGFVAVDDLEYSVGVDCTGTETDSVKKGRQLDPGGIAASVIVTLLLIVTLLALMVIYLRNRNRQTAPPAGPTGFSNDAYEDLMQDHIIVPPAENHRVAAGFNHFSVPDDISSVE